MADKLQDLNPLAVSFEPGERPADTKLDAWAAQIETAFLRVENILGDLYHNQENDLDPGYFLNLGRILGQVGTAQFRLPTREAFTYRQHLAPNLRQFELDWYPAAQPPANVFVQNANQNDCITNLGVANPNTRDAANRDSIGAGQWWLDGRKLFTELLSGPGGAGNEYVDYLVNTGGTAFRQNYGPLREGPSLIPSAAQIDQNVTAPPAFNDYLCSVVDDGAGTAFTVTLPDVRWYYDRTGTATDMIIGGAGTSGISGTIPNYNLPRYFTDSVATGGLGLVNGDSIPTGLIQVWRVSYDGVATITGITPVRNTSADDPIVYTYLSDTSFRFTIPATMTAPVVDAGFPNRNFVVTCAGYNVSSILKHLLDGLLDHDHGADETTSVSHRYLEDCFNETTYTHSQIARNDHPQYLHREGYDATDTQNGRNSTLGDLHLGSTAAPATMTDSNNYAANDSYKLLLGTAANAEGIYFDTAFLADSGGPAWAMHSSRPLWLHNTNNNDLFVYFGKDPGDADEGGGYLYWDDNERFLSIQNSVAADANPHNIGFSAGVLEARQGIVYFAAGNTVGDVDDPTALARYIKYDSAGGPGPSSLFTVEFGNNAALNYWMGHAGRWIPEDQNPAHVTFGTGQGAGQIPLWSVIFDDTDGLLADKLRFHMELELPQGAQITQVDVQVDPDNSGFHTLRLDLWSVDPTDVVTGAVLLAGQEVNAGTGIQLITLDNASGTPLPKPALPVGLDSLLRHYLTMEVEATNNPLTSSSRIHGVKVTYSIASLPLR